MNKQNNSLTEGQILSPLIKFALPVLGSLVLQAMYGAVDLLVVGQYGSTNDVSAVTTGSQIMSLITHVITGLSMGATVLVGRNIGAGNKKKAGEIIGAAVVLFAALAVLLTVIVPSFASPIASLMHAPESAFKQTCQYLTVCGLGLIFVSAYNLLGSIFRGIGDSKTPFISVIIACILNIAGDLFFVRALNLATVGVALATTLSQAISVIICLVIIKKKKALPFDFDRNCLKKPVEDIKNIFKVGIPIALQSLIVSLSFSIITATINNIGVVESAGVGVAEKVCIFIMLIPSSFSQALSAFVAQNMGAKKPERATKGLKYSIMISIAIAIVISYVGFFHGYLLTGLFSHEEAVIMASWEYLKGYSIDVLLTSFMFCFVGYFNGLGKTTFVMLQGILSAFCVRVPVSILMSKQLPVSLFKISLATPAATLSQVIACLIYFRYCQKRIEKSRNFTSETLKKQQF